MDLSYFARAAAPLLARYKTGQMEGEQERDARDRQTSLDLFNRYARQRQMQQTDAQLQSTEGLRQAQLKQAFELQKAREAQDLEQDRLRQQTQRDLATDRDRTYRETQQAIEEGRRERAANADATRRFLGTLARQGGGRAAQAPAKPPTEGESKDYLYYTNIQRGQQAMDQTRQKIRPAVISSYLTSRWFKPALTPEEQLFVRGARDFAAGVLRKETGATVRDDELRDVFGRYIDAGVDAPELREAKRQAREDLVGVFDRLSGRARRYYDDQTAPSDAFDPDAFLKSHRGKKKPT